MGYALQPGLSVCLSDGRPVFLDMIKDRYFCLGGAEELCFLRLLDGGEPGAHEREQMDRLMAGGILREQPAATILATCQAEPPVMSLFDLVEARFHRARVVSLLAHIAFASITLRWRTLARCMGNLAMRKAHDPDMSAPDEDVALRAVIEAFRWTGLILSTHDRCLSRSIGLSRYLARRRIAHVFVFGVTLRPFRAHCWLQQDRIVLTDRLDTVRSFTPILVV